MDSETKKIKVMIVDDEENVRNALRRVLMREGYEVLVAGDAETALKIIKKELPDVVISDYLMPDCNGVDFLIKVQDILPECVRIILTAHADVDMVIDAINRSGIYRLLTKPWNDGELRILLKQIEEHISLIKENASLKTLIKKQEDMLIRLEKEYPGISSLKRAADGRIIIE